MLARLSLIAASQLMHCHGADARRSGTSLLRPPNGLAQTQTCAISLTHTALQLLYSHSRIQPCLLSRAHTHTHKLPFALLLILVVFTAPTDGVCVCADFAGQSLGWRLPEPLPDIWLRLAISRQGRE